MTYDKLRKMRPLIDLLEKAFKAEYDVGGDNKNSMKDKPTKWEMKVQQKHFNKKI